MANTHLEMFAVRSKDGKWFRAKGYGGYGSSWVEELGQAKIYPKISPARRQVTYWSNTYPEYGIPDIVKLKVTELEVLDEAERVEKAKITKERKELAHKKWLEQEAYDNALRKLEEAKETLKKFDEKHFKQD